MAQTVNVPTNSTPPRKKSRRARRKIASALRVCDRFRARDGQPWRAADLAGARRLSDVARCLSHIGTGSLITLAAKAACVAGVVLGTNFWFCALSFGVSRSHGRLSEKTLLRMQHISGFCLLVAGLYGGAHIAWQLARHQI